jgi:lipoyl(octanoyl) transferase
MPLAEVALDVGRIGPLRWSARVDGALPGALNMARDHALASSLSPGEAVLRLYGWERPTLSLGRNEPALDRYDAAELRRQGVDVVRRPSGGRAVLHWRELTYAVVVPARSLSGPRAAYRWIHLRMAAALAGLGIAADIAPDTPRAAGVDAGPCFQLAGGGEIVVGGRKLVGSAQLRVGAALLQHGSILIADDQRRVAELAGGEAGQPDGPATVSDLLGRMPAPNELQAAVLRAFGVEEAWAADPPPTSSLEAELERHYRSDAWTWRR